ncbi:hypothetical protein Cfor_03553 [Coptotermes formosanus]|uniref:Uncharacterized protein n=1 Tax=Coptotermes formosanus TaxID=36987 RepID=A0A6L2QBB2_COPFO|nr:hypothetical protein Cfor_03553 [Coptotermes formosanus]
MHWVPEGQTINQIYYKEVLTNVREQIKSALKGTRLESIDAVKAKATELMNKLSEDDLQHCFEKCKMRMERCRDRGGEYIEGDNISIV